MSSNIRVPDLNKVLIAGRLTADPELKYIASGRAVCNLNLANNQYYKDKSGEKQEKKCFVQIAIWDKMAEWCGEHLKKGAPVIVEARLDMEEWEDRDTGKKRTKHKLTAQRVSPLEWTGQKPEGDGKAEPRQERDRGGSSRYEDEPIPEDDIPF